MSNGSGGFTCYDNPLQNKPAVAGSPHNLRVGDFNGDGKSDLYFHWKHSGQNRLFLSTGGEQLTYTYYDNPIGVGAIDDAPDSMVVGDFNGDGLSDVYFHWKDLGRNRLFLATGDGSFTFHSDPHPCIPGERFSRQHDCQRL